MKKSMTVGDMRNMLNTFPDNAIITNPSEGEFEVRIPDNNIPEYPVREIAPEYPTMTEYHDMGGNTIEPPIRTENLCAEDLKYAANATMLAVANAAVAYGTDEYAGLLINVGACIERMGSIRRKLAEKV